MTNQSKEIFKIWKREINRIPLVKREEYTKLMNQKMYEAMKYEKEKREESMKIFLELYG